MPNQGKEKVVMAWKDNAAVMMALNCFCSELIQKAKRWDQKEKKELSVYMPYVDHKYNTLMRCTDC